MMRWIVALVLAVQTAVPAQHDVHNIIQQSVNATTRDWKASSDYGYSERVREDGGTKTYDVMMIRVGNERIQVGLSRLNTA
jgi:hypothetical protein